MFTRLYHPYKTSAPLSSPLKAHHPAGFRIPDYINPKLCFNLFQGPNFTNPRSPDPSPFSSPIKGGRHPEDAPPPTVRLADFLGGDGLRSPERPSTPSPGCRQNASPQVQKTAVPSQDPLTNPLLRKGKYRPKQLTMNSDAIRSHVLGPHRRSRRSKEKRQRVPKRFLERHERLGAEARDEMRSLRMEAEALMRTAHMDDEDRIFLKQLRGLQLDHEWKHDLEQCRQRMSRAAEESKERRREHAERDEEAANMWHERQDEMAQEEQKRKVAEFVRMKEEGKAASRRRREEAALRAEEERRLAHEIHERKIREAQERLFREELARKAKEEEARKMQEERARKLREEIERQLREAQERVLREERERHAKAERERQARLRAEQVRPAPTFQDEQVHQHFVLYEAKWSELRTNNSLPPIDVTQLPWPVLSAISSADQITYQDVRSFVLHSRRPLVEGKTARDKVKAEVLRFHPDKFNTRIVPKVQPSQQAVAQDIAGAVARILTRIMTEEVEKETRNV